MLAALFSPLDAVACSTAGTSTSTASTTGDASGDAIRAARSEATADPRSLTSVLTAVLREARRRAARISDFDDAVVRVRNAWRERCSEQQGASDDDGGFVVVPRRGEDSSGRLVVGGGGARSDGDGDGSFGESGDEFDATTAGWQSFVEAYVLLTDWIKELAATLEAQCMVRAVDCLAIDPLARPGPATEGEGGQDC